MQGIRKYIFALCFTSVLFFVLISGSDVKAQCGVGPQLNEGTKTKNERERLFTPSSDYEEIILIPNEDWEPEEEEKPTQESKKAQEESDEKNKIYDQISVRWLENLKLRDFILSREFLELKGTRLKDYRINLEKGYISNPDVFSAAVSYGLLLIDLGEFDRAKSVWERAVEDFYANPTPKVYKAWVDAAAGNYLEAKNAWFPVAQEKINLGISGSKSGIWLPHHVDAVVGLYLIKDYLPEIDKKEASEASLEIAKHFANNPKFASILIIDDLNNGRLTEAAGRISNILQREPENPTTITLLGIANLISGHNEDALRILEKANELHPSSPSNYLMRARILYSMARKKEASLLLEKAIELDQTLNSFLKKKEKFLVQKTYLSEEISSKKILKKAEKKEKDKKAAGQL